MKVIKENEPKETYVVFVLDDSGSMSPVREQTISGFNEQLQAIKTQVTPDHKIFLSVIKFSEPHKIQTVRRWTSPSDIAPLAGEDYHAQGASTALLDAMDTGITLLNEIGNRINLPGNAALMVTMTDGLNNSSIRVTSKSHIKEKIQALTNRGNHTFTFMGIGDVDSISGDYGIAKGNIAQFQYGAAGMHVNTTASVGAHNSYFGARASGQTASSSLYSPTPAEEDKEDKPTIAGNTNPPTSTTGNT